MVIEYLPSLNGKYEAQVFGFKLDERHKEHAESGIECFVKKTRGLQSL